MSAAFWSALQSFLVIAFVASPVSVPDARKCGTMSPQGVLKAVDGLVSPLGDAKQPSFGVDRESVYSVEILCMEPRDSTFNRRTGWQLVAIWTTQGPAPRVKEVLNVIRDAQDAHFARHGRYITDVSELELPEHMRPLKITLKVDAKGWMATATLPRWLQECSMYDGTGRNQLSAGPRTTMCWPLESN